MKDELVFVKSNFVNHDFKRIGEYTNPSKDKFDKAIEHKIFIPTGTVNIVRDNKKLLCSFLTIRVIGDNTLMTLDKTLSSFWVGVIFTIAVASPITAAIIANTSFQCALIHSILFSHILRVFSFTTN